MFTAGVSLTSDKWDFSYLKLTVAVCVKVRSSRFKALRKFGEHERRARVSRGVKSNYCCFSTQHYLPG